MSDLEKLRSDFRISKGQIVFVPRADLLTQQVEEMVEAIDYEDNPFANQARFWGNGEYYFHEGANAAFTARTSFHGGVDQRRSVGRIFLAQEGLSEAILECRAALSECSFANR